MLEAESTFAHFKIIRRLGVGGMGEPHGVIKGDL